MLPEFASPVEFQYRSRQRQTFVLTFNSCTVKSRVSSDIARWTSTSLGPFPRLFLCTTSRLATTSTKSPILKDAGVVTTGLPWSSKRRKRGRLFNRQSFARYFNLPVGSSPRANAGGLVTSSSPVLAQSGLCKHVFPHSVAIGCLPFGKLHVVGAMSRIVRCLHHRTAPEQRTTWRSAEIPIADECLRATLAFQLKPEHCTRGRILRSVTSTLK